MKGVTSIIIKKMIRYYGQTVKHKRRISHTEGGEVYYTYEVKEPKRGQFMQLTALDQALNRWGVQVDADYIGTFLPGTDIQEGDLLEVDESWYEVQNVMYRRTRGEVDYIEVLLRHKEG